MRLLVHVAGEADLLLRSGGQQEDRVEQVAKRRCKLAAAAAGPDGPTAVHQLLREGEWGDSYPSTCPPSPLLGALDTVVEGPDLDVVVVGTCQDESHPLDTLLTAETLVAALACRHAGTDPANTFRQASVIKARGFGESHVLDAFSDYLAKAPRYRQALVTWGSGATGLVMGALTALSKAGIPWQLVLTSGSEAYQVVDPLESLENDPVAGVLVRWRMFDALADLADRNPPVVRLTPAARRVVQEAVERRSKGFEARDADSLRAVVADAVVRRDGTASLTVRRYITRRYEELFKEDRDRHGWPKDLLHRDEKLDKLPLGKQLGAIEHRHHDDPMICASVDLPSYKWLFGPEVSCLQNIGRGSHNLQPPSLCDSKVIGRYLAQYSVDGSGWESSGLPEPPIAPTGTVLAVWLAGNSGNPKTVGRQLLRALPEDVLKYLGMDEVFLRAVVFGTEGENGSRAIAEVDAALVCSRRDERTEVPLGEGWAELVDLKKLDLVQIEQAIERRVTRETGALLFVPTGSKDGVLTLLRAMRLIAARHGIPLFVRENAEPEDGGEYKKVHLWPALTGGDLPLLNAAEKALRSLELDVAWRLLAASAIDKDVVDRARRLAEAFASRQPWSSGKSPKKQQNREPWTRGLVVQRLELVQEALSRAKQPADRIRLLVLAADAMEASIAAARTSEKKHQAYRDFRKGLENKVSEASDKPKVRDALVLLLLNAARDRAPVTHGTETTPDEVVLDGLKTLAEKHKFNQAECNLPQDVSTLLSDAIHAAASWGLGQPSGQRDSLLKHHRQILAEVQQTIAQRTANTPMAPEASPQAL